MDEACSHHLPRPAAPKQSRQQVGAGSSVNAPSLTRQLCNCSVGYHIRPQQVNISAS